jgi:hypothetical protein
VGRRVISTRAEKGRIKYRSMQQSNQKVKINFLSCVITA